jgi:hypothetical protein
MIGKPEYAKAGKHIREYFDEFVRKVSATGKNEKNK